MSDGAIGSPDTAIRVAVDAMGGDHAPAETVKGAVEAARTQPVRIALVGDQDAIERELASCGLTGAEGSRITVVPAVGRIGDDEHPLQALRSKPDASVAVATKMVKGGAADAVVSMGSTGATMASSALALGMLPGLERPCIGGPFLGLAPKTVLIDMGSSVDCRTPLLLSFAAMGSVFASSFLGIENPRVGLLSVGSEEAKGNRQVQEAYQLFKDSTLNFVGNVEGMDFFTGKADVIVCDGFVGNILLKFTEGLGATISQYLKRALRDKLPNDQLDSLVYNVWEANNLPRKMGGPLFGVDGAVVVGHGSSKADGVSGAIDTARRLVELDLVDSFRNQLAALGDAEAGSQS